MTDAERLAAIKCTLIRTMTVQRELIDQVEEKSGKEFCPETVYRKGGAYGECFHEGSNFGAGSYAESLLNQYFPKEG
tara:strand:+ start:1369 stop:1599 length:231 start_codon:yes stop_codon:yes gene_type:complete